MRAVFPDNTCGTTGIGGSSQGQTCPTALPCCSVNGFCGSTEEYCSTAGGCQSAFGTCNTRAANPIPGNRCGPGMGSCASNQCCSLTGYCGVTEGKNTLHQCADSDRWLAEYCETHNCQIDFGPACDANKVPSRSNTSWIARSKLGSMLYGSAGIYDCDQAGEMALTFDDGPSEFTSHILDLLKQYNASATFFITGNNNAMYLLNFPNFVPDFQPWSSIQYWRSALGHARSTYFNHQFKSRH